MDIDGKFNPPKMKLGRAKTKLAGSKLTERLNMA